MKKQKTIENRGGARPGAGRKGSGIETTTIAFRVPADMAEQLKVKITTLIKRDIKRPR